MKDLLCFAVDKRKRHVTATRKVFSGGEGSHFCYHNTGRECNSSVTFVPRVCLGLGLGRNGMYFIIDRFLIRCGSRGSYKDTSPCV